MNDLVRGAFGQLVPIGTLYNAKSDSFLDASILRSGQHFHATSQRKINAFKITHNASGKYGSRIGPLGVSHDTAASIISGAIKVQGSSDYLQAEFDSPGSLHGAYHYIFSTVVDELDLRVSLREHIDVMPLQTRDSTHVVTGITWGMRNTLVINHEFSGDSPGPQVERAFFRDLSRLEALTQSITGHPESDSHETSPLELPYSFYLYTDASKEGLEMTGLDAMRTFVRLRLGELPKTNDGKGCPLSYTLLPIDKLDRHIPGFQRIDVVPIPLPIDDFTEFMGLFDEFASCKKRLGNYYKSLLEKRSYVSEEHIRDVYHSISLLNQWKTQLQQRLAPTLVSIRMGAMGPQHLHNLYSNVEAEAGSPRRMSPFIGQETEKLRLLAEAIAAGAVYIGHGESPLEKIKTLHNDPGCHAFLLSTAATQQKIIWDHQCNSLMRLLRQSNQGKPVYVVDCDAPSCRLELEDARMVEHQSGRELVTELVWEYPIAPTPDVSQATQGTWGAASFPHIQHLPPDNNLDWQFPDTQDANGNEDSEDYEDDENPNPLLEYCFARYGPDPSKIANRSDTEGDLRPVDRRFVKIPCPGIRCDRNTPCEWICFHCSEPLEFGVTDDYIYCDCGHHPHGSYDFKCNGESHGPGFDRYPLDNLSTMLRKLKPDSVNILILGETGVGKSTFINGFLNYLTHDTLDEAKAAKKLKLLIPCSFSTQIMNRDNPDQEIQERIIRVGTPRQDEVDGVEGESATQQTNVYAITVGTKRYRLFDTPGIGDTRGSNHDNENIADMMKMLSNYQDIHGILILLKSNSSRLNVMFRFCIKELLAHLHLSAVSNVVFGFTNTRVSEYTAGDVFGPLKKLLGEHDDLHLNLTTSTTYCFDSESFRYLAAYSQGITLPNEEGMRNSWEHSKNETQRLVQHLESRTPHDVNSTLSMNGARRQVEQLMKPMSEISRCIAEGIVILEKSKEDLTDRRLKGEELREKLHPEVPSWTAKKLAKPRTICTAKSCSKVRISNNGDKIIVSKRQCHADCTLPNVRQETLADPALKKCRAFDRGKRDICNATGCRHRWQLHMHILYEAEEVTIRIKDEEIGRLLEINASDLKLREAASINLEKRIFEYRHELHKMQEARALFFVFLSKNAMTPINDSTVEYLDMLIHDEESKVESGRQLGFPVDKNKETLKNLRRDRQAHLDLVEAYQQNTHRASDQQLTRKGIDDLVKSLYSLKHFGQGLKSVENTITSSHRATYRERPFRVPRPGGRQAARSASEKRLGGEGAVVVHGGKHESRRKKGGQGGLGGWLPSLTRR